MSDELKDAVERWRSDKHTKWLYPGGGSQMEADCLIMARAYLEQELRLDELSSYLKHKGNCPASTQMWARMESGLCDCGLDALLAALGIEVRK